MGVVGRIHQHSGASAHHLKAARASDLGKSIFNNLRRQSPTTKQAFGSRQSQQRIVGLILAVQRQKHVLINRCGRHQSEHLPAHSKLSASYRQSPIFTGQAFSFQIHAGIKADVTTYILSQQGALICYRLQNLGLGLLRLGRSNNCGTRFDNPRLFVSNFPNG